VQVDSRGLAGIGLKQKLQYLLLFVLKTKTSTKSEPFAQNFISLPQKFLQIFLSEKVFQESLRNLKGQCHEKIVPKSLLGDALGLEYLPLTVKKIFPIVRLNATVQIASLLDIGLC
jgi:hypothetical protein